MNAPEPLKALDFIDLKSQYTALRETINARIQRVLPVPHILYHIQ